MQSLDTSHGLHEVASVVHQNTWCGRGFSTGDIGAVWVKSNTGNFLAMAIKYTLSAILDILENYIF